MADLGTLRTFVNNFRDALDVLDEATRTAGVITERRTVLEQINQQIIAAQADAFAAQEAVKQAEVASQKDQATFRAMKADLDRQWECDKATHKTNLDTMLQEYQRNRVSLAHDLDVVGKQLEDRRSALAEVEGRLSEARAKLQELLHRIG